MSAGPPLPAGTVTFLFTDIEGFTLSCRSTGPAYADLLAEHRGVIREEVARRDGAGPYRTRGRALGRSSLRKA